MAKLTLNPVANISGAESTAIGTLNTNFDAIEASLENTLSRDGTNPNQMNADLDLNNNDILNVDNIHASTIVLDGVVIVPTEITEVIPINKGGTGATTASSARNNLSVYSRDETIFTCADRATLKLINPLTIEFARTVDEGGRDGSWNARLISSLSAAEQAAIALDTLEGVYVTSTQNALYVWVREAGYNISGFRPEWFGAVYNSTGVDNSAVLLAAVKMGPVQLGAGYLHISSNIVPPDNTNIDIRGAGTLASELRFSGAVTTGILATNTLTGYAAGTAYPNIRMSNLSFTTANDPVTDSSIGIDITWPDGFTAARGLPTARFTSVIFKGTNSETSGWTRAINIHQACNIVFDECYFIGKDEGGAADQTPAKKTRSDYGVYMDGGWVPCEVHFNSCQFYHWKDGIKISGSFEGLYLNSSVFLSCNNAITYIPTVFSIGWPGPTGSGGSAVGRPLLSVVQCHANIYERAVNCDGVVQVSLIGNDFYHSPWSTTDGALIVALNGHDWVIDGNHFVSYSFTNVATGVIIGTNMGYAKIINNTFETKGVGIWFQVGGVGNNIESGNIFKGTFATASIFNQLNEDAVAHGHRTALLYRSAVQSIPNNTNTLISWDTKEHSNIGFTAGTSITIPAYSGIRRVRVSAGIVWDASATGSRILQLFKNGAVVIGGATDIQPTMTTGSTSQYITSAILNVAENDVLAINVFQNSGVALNAQSSGNTWVSIEVIE